MNAGGMVPSGVLALSGDALRKQRDAERRCLERLEARGFEPVHLPVLEFSAETTGRGYRFVDASGRVVALRTDFTPLAARVLGATLANAPLPLSVCYAGEVVRPRPVRLRQIPELYQLGFERYGVAGGASDALEITVELLELAGVDVRAGVVAVGVAGLAEEVLARLLAEPADAELVELLRARDVDAIAEATGARDATVAALEDALFSGRDDGWAEALGVQDTTRTAAPLLEWCAIRGIPATFDVAARPIGDYYRGVMFSIWGGLSRAVVAAGGEYAVSVPGRGIPAVGACITLSLALEEASC